MTVVANLHDTDESINDYDRPLDTTQESMNKISILLLAMVAVAVALVVGLLVIAPEGMVENPPGSVVLPFVLEF